MLVSTTDSPSSRKSHPFLSFLWVFNLNFGFSEGLNSTKLVYSYRNCGLIFFFDPGKLTFISFYSMGLNGSSSFFRMGSSVMRVFLSSSPSLLAGSKIFSTTPCIPCLFFIVYCYFLFSTLYCSLVIKFYWILSSNYLCLTISASGRFMRTPYVSSVAMNLSKCLNLNGF